MKSRYQSISTCLFLIVLVFACMTTAQAQEVQVNSANPNSAEQGTVELDVEIKGSGFDNSAAVDFFVTGTTNPGGITVKKVKVRGSKKIIATIDVSDTAIVDDFDIEVSLSSGRGGKGTTLFSVKQKKGPPAEGMPVTVAFFADAGNRITSDGLETDTYDSGLADGGAISRFILDLRDTTRELKLDFTDCVSGCDDDFLPPFLTDGLTIDALMFLDVANGGDFINIDLFSSANGVLQVNFNASDGVAYGVKFDSARELGTDDVQIKHTSDETTGGHAWQITTNSTAVARLFKRGGKGGPKKRIDIGDYKMPTRFTLEEN